MLHFYKNLLFLGLVSYLAPASAGGPWRVSLDMGYGHFQDMFYNDGYYPSLKVALGKAFTATERVLLGLELGMETGNTMRLNVPKPLLAEIGGMPFQSTVKPIFDALGTMHVNLSQQFLAVLKGGAAVRSWQFERCSSSDRIWVNPEVQAGVAYQINQKSYLEFAYRLIIGSPLSYSVTNEQLYISGSPTQQGILLGITLLLDNETH